MSEFCNADLRSSLKEKGILDEDVEYLLRLAKAKVKSGMGGDAAINAVIKDFEHNALVEQVEHHYNAQTVMNAAVHFDKYKNLPIGDKRTGFLEYIRGGGDDFRMGMFGSSETTALGLAAKLRGGLLNKLSRMGLEEVLLEGGQLNSALTFEVTRLQQVWASKEGIPFRFEEIAPTKDPIVAKAADAIFTAMTENFILAAEFAPRIRLALDYVHANTHSWEKIRKSTPEEWVKKVKESYDLEQTFPGVPPENYDQILAYMYSDFAHGVSSWTKDLDETGEHLTELLGSNLAKKLAHARVLIPKSVDGFLSYNKDFGRGNLLQTILHGFETKAKDIAVIHRFGSNPARNLNTTMKMLSKGSREWSELLGDKTFQNDIAVAFDLATFSGSSFKANATAWRVVAGNTAQIVGGLTQLSKNNAQAINTVLDLSPGSFVPSWTLRGPLGNFMELSALVVKKTVGGFLPGGAQMSRLEAESMSVFVHRSVDYFLADVGMGVASDAGLIAKGVQFQSRLLLADKMVAGMHAAYGEWFAKDFAAVVADPKLHVDPRFTTHLESYGISPKLIPILQQAIMPSHDLNVPILTPNTLATAISLGRIEAGAVEKAMGITKPLKRPDIAGYAPNAGIGVRSPSRAEWDLILRFGSMINDQVQFGTSTPGLAEKQFMYGGQGFETAAGSARRLAWVFMGSQVKMLKGMLRVYRSNPDKPRGDLGALGFMFAANAGLLILTDTLKDMGHLNEPRDPFTTDNLNRVLSRSGAGIIVGEMVYEALRKSHDMQSLGLNLATALPAASTAVDLGKVILGGGYAGGQAAYEAMGGDIDREDRFRLREGEIPRTIMRNMPLAGGWWYKSALDWAIVDNVIEQFDPQHVSKKEKYFRDSGGMFSEDRQHLLDPNERPDWFD